MELLAGPILRHANQDEIHIWFVLDTKTTAVDAEIRAKDKILGTSVTESRKPVQAGEHAFVYLLKTTPRQGKFPVDELLSYDLVLDGERLADLKLTTGEARISYADGELPGLVLKEHHNVILEGSCRKPHASDWKNNSQTDMFAVADTLMSAHRHNLAKRPSMMFLTGDQIYADDVAAPLLAKIKKLVRKFIGFDQRIPKTPRSSVRVSTLDLNGRVPVLSSKSMGFTSGEKANHLLSFGEYFMMYCVIWGGIEPTCPPFAEIQNEMAQEGYEGEMDKLSNVYGLEKNIVETFLKDARRVRRLMANIPTYMIFDDHDVTDDWNLDAEVHRAFTNHPFSRHVQTNAMAAYWLCQGWGNDPADYSTAFKSKLQKYLLDYPETEFEKLESALLNRYWGYEIATYPYIVVLDVRTKREYQADKLVKLMGPKALAEVATRLAAVPESLKKDNALVLVSSAPVYGFTEYERKILATASNDTFRRGLDVECWIANEMAFKQLQSTILDSGFDCCAILSGDVHFGYCRYEQLVNSAGAPIKIFQLTSSSLHNAPGTLKWLGLGYLEREAFMKHSTQYLIPRNSDDNFINSSTNIGMLELNKGRPVNFYMLDSDVANNNKPTSWLDSKRGPAWVYDLVNPQRLP